MERQQHTLYKAEEHGQARELKSSEVLAFGLISGLKATAVGVGAVAVVTGGRLVIGEHVSLTSVALTGGGVFAVSLVVHLLGDLDTLIDGLRSWRSIESFGPSQPDVQPEQSRWRPPIPIVRRDEVRMLDMNEGPALPQPEAESPLTPQRLLEILSASVENDGSFSRRTITGIKLSDGGKVTRGMWREAAYWLHRVGILRQDTRGAYCLPHQVRDMDDLYIQLPGLPRLTGPDRRGTYPVQSTAQPAQSSARSLAERRKQQWLECDCNVELYLKQRPTP